MSDLPQALGLRNFGNDRYRGMIYIARDIGYQQLPEIATFQEFSWGRWLRKAANPAVAISRYDLNDLTSYLTFGQSDLPSDGRPWQWRSRE